MSFSVVGVCALVACGGGGGGAAVVAAPLISQGPVAVSAANQDAVAQESVSTALGVTDSNSAITGAQSIDEFAVYSLATNQITNIANYFQEARANAAQIGAVASRTYSCTNGGTMNASTNDADNNSVLSAGDSVSLSFSNCREGSVTMSGGMSMTINGTTGNPNSSIYTLSTTLAFSNFNGTTANSAVGMSGSTTVSIQSTATYNKVVTTTTPSLNVSATYAGATRSRTTKDFSSTSTMTPYLSSYQLNITASGTVISTALTTKEVSFTTPTAFVRYYNESYPHSGVFVATGATGSKLRLTAISNSLVTQELDANGDGTYEANKTVAWSALK